MASLKTTYLLLIQQMANEKDRIDLKKQRSPETQRYIDSLKDENNEKLPLLKDRSQEICNVLHKRLTERHASIASGYAFRYSVHKRYIKIEEYTCRRPVVKTLMTHLEAYTLLLTSIMATCTNQPAGEDLPNMLDITY